MHNFQYVLKKDYSPILNELHKIIHEVQNVVQNKFSFEYFIVGSADKNMITCDRKSNIGFDFDIDIYVHNDDENYTPKEIRTILRQAMDKIAPKYGYDYCEDSTRVLTIKKKNTKQAKILHSCDFAIVYNRKDGQLYIRYNKKHHSYSWEFQGCGFESLPDKIEWIKENNLWNDLRKYYLDKKNYNIDDNKHSRSLFAEAVHEIYQKYS